MTMKNLHFLITSGILLKSFRFLLIYTLVGFLTQTLTAQPWMLQQAIGLPNSLNPTVAFSAVDDNTCWGFNSANSQFLRTTDGGTNWTVSTITGAAGLKGSGISALDANTAWIIMIDPSNTTSGGIFKTTDGGLNWVKQTTAFQGTGGHPNVIHFFDADNGVCVGDPRNGYWEIYTSTNGGSDWTRIPAANIPPPIPSNELGISGHEGESFGNSLWFGTFWGSLYRTTDRGMTWTVARNIIGDFDGFGFAFKDSLNGLACTFVTGKKLSHTSDGGATWTRFLPLPTGLSALSTFYINYVKGTNGSYIITSHNNTGGTEQAIPGSAYSIDNGVTWTYINDLPYGKASFSSSNVGWSSGINDSVYKWNSDGVLSVKEIDKVAESYHLEQNFPNPFTEDTKIQFDIAQNAGSQEVSLIVYDASGKTVANLIDRRLSPGTYEVAFDGTNLPCGIYYYKLQSGSFTATRKMILLK